MRTFLVQGPYDLNSSLSTDVPGFLSISVPGSAQSEPVFSSAVSSPPSLLRSQSNYTVSIHSSQRTFNNKKSSFASRASTPPTHRGAFSTLTEIDSESVDPTPDKIAADLQSRNIKVRDFAYFSPLPIPEIFDPYEALAEYEYRLSQRPRTAPITGKSLRRLLSMRWLSPSELAARLDVMDWDALRTHDAGLSAAYPYKTLSWKHVPAREERVVILKDRGALCVAMDLILKSRRDAEGREEREREEARRVWEMLQRAKREIDLIGAKKRANVGDDDGKPKRLKLTSPPTMPPKQYPAPLTSYNPELYPHAASLRQIAGLSAPAPSSFPKDQRQDTPPLEVRDGGGKKTGEGLEKKLKNRVN